MDISVLMNKIGDVVGGAVLAIALPVILQFWNADSQAMELAPPIPAVVVQRANAYVKAHPGSDRKLTGPSTAMELFASYFFHGFTNADGSLSSDLPIFNAAFKEGQAYWKNSPDQRDALFIAYGYRKVELDGTLGTGLETSHFKPDNEITPKQATDWRPGNQIWLSLLPGAGTALPTPAYASDGSGHKIYRVRVTGYLSPPGPYGHLNLYGRQLFAMSIAALPGDSRKPTVDPSRVR